VSGGGAMEAATKLRIRKNDIVKVISGKEKGKVGRVLKVDREKERVYIEKINMVKRHIKPSKTHPQGGIVEKEAPMSSSNVMIMCDKCNKPTRVAKSVDGAVKRSRTCKHCGDVLAARTK